MVEDKPQFSVRGKTPPDSGFSTVMNSIGNWTMIGTLPFVISESVAHIRGKTLSPTLAKANLALLATGTIIGTVFGFREARHLRDYRTALTEDLAELHAQQKDRSTR